MVKAPKPEDEYFGKIDVEKLKKIAEAKGAKLAADEREKLKELHFRRCAGCGMELEPISFRAVTIYKCFHCNGVFLEAGTLEKLCGEESRMIESLFDLFKF